MIKRIIEIGSKAHVSCRLNQLIVKNESGEHSVPIEDIGFLILDNPAITHSSALLARCLENQTAVLICDEKHLPAGMLLPMVGHTKQAGYMTRQTAASKPAKKRLWQEIVRAKIAAQRAALNHHNKDLPALGALINKVRSGDPDNVEAQAARAYFRALFGNSFRRSDEASAVNAALNYGYAVMRAACARALVGAGLHPSIGIHHHNQYDAFCLADDIVEPLRPFVDRRVRRLMDTAGDMRLGAEVKRDLLGCLSEECRFAGQKAPLMVLLQDYCASVRKALFGEQKSISFPRM